MAAVIESAQGLSGGSSVLVEELGLATPHPGGDLLREAEQQQGGVLPLDIQLRHELRQYEDTHNRIKTEDKLEFLASVIENKIANGQLHRSTEDNTHTPLAAAAALVELVPDAVDKAVYRKYRESRGILAMINPKSKRMTSLEYLAAKDSVKGSMTQHFAERFNMYANIVERQQQSVAPAIQGVPLKLEEHAYAAATPRAHQLLVDKRQELIEFMVNNPENFTQDPAYQKLLWQYTEGLKLVTDYDRTAATQGSLVSSVHESRRVIERQADHTTTTEEQTVTREHKNKPSKGRIFGALALTAALIGAVYLIYENDRNDSNLDEKVEEVAETTPSTLENAAEETRREAEAAYNDLADEEKQQADEFFETVEEKAKEAEAAAQEIVDDWTDTLSATRENMATTFFTTLRDLHDEYPEETDEQINERMEAIIALAKAREDYIGSATGADADRLGRDFDLRFYKWASQPVSLNAARTL